MAVKNPEFKKYKDVDLLHITNKLNENKELADEFVSDLLRVTGFEVDEEGYIVDTDVDGDPEYILCKGKALRYTNRGILHNTDTIFDPYSNNMIIEEMFRNYLTENHPEVSIAQIYAYEKGELPKINSYGYIRILYGNGSAITTGCHWKDSTKYLEAFMRLEAMNDMMINDVLRKYDEWENEFFTDPKNQGEVF